MRLAIKTATHHRNVVRLRMEKDIYDNLRGVIGFPRVLTNMQSNSKLQKTWFGMTLLGMNLKQMQKLFAEHVVPVEIVCNIAAQVMYRLQALHGTGYLHCDLKPENLMIDEKRARTVKKGIVHSAADLGTIYLIDMGLAQRFRDARTHKHVPSSTPSRIRGTLLYTSLNSHQRLQLSRRDDLESLAYVLVFLAKGTLPWKLSPAESAKMGKKERYEAVKKLKQNIDLFTLCKGLPKVFRDFLSSARSMAFEREPDYAFWCNAFLGVCNKE